MATINVNNASEFIPEIWSKEVLSYVTKNLVMANLVENYSDGISGNTYKIPVAGGFTARDKVANTAVVLQSPTNGLVSINLDKHKHISFIVEDILSLQAVQSNPTLLGKYTENAGLAIAEAIDTDLMGLYAGLTQGVGTYGSAITEDIVLEAKLKLDKANAPRTSRSLVVSPEQENALLKIDRFTRNDAYGVNMAIREGQLGKIHGFDVFSTTNVITTDTTHVHNMAFQKGAFALVTELAPRVQAEYSLKDLGWLVVVDAVYGVAELKDTYAVEVKS